MTKGNFMSVGDHYEALVAQLTEGEAALYSTMRNVRQETAFLGRTFVVYEMVDREKPRILDRITFGSFSVHDRMGASVELHSERTSLTQIVSYRPVCLFEFDVFIHLPLHLKLRWSGSEQDIAACRGSLGYDVVIRTKSRRHLHERNVRHCETAMAFSQEFASDQL